MTRCKPYYTLKFKILSLFLYGKWSCIKAPYFVNRHFVNLAAFKGVLFTFYTAVSLQGIFVISWQIWAKFYKTAFDFENKFLIRLSMSEFLWKNSFCEFLWINNICHKVRVLVYVSSKSSLKCVNVVKYNRNSVVL